MEQEQQSAIRLGLHGEPVLDQFSEEGFVDCCFAIEDLASTSAGHRFRLVADFRGTIVGLKVRVVRGIQGGFDANLALIPAHVYRGGVEFSRSGPESDRLMWALAELYGLPSAELRMVEAFSFTAIALHQVGPHSEAQPINIKLFGRDGDGEQKDDYFESFFNFDLRHRLVFWNEKDVSYREPLIRGLAER